MAIQPNHVGAPARSDAWKWWVCGLLLLATMLNYMDRQTLSLTIEDIYADFGRSPQRYGLTESAFSVAFALGAILVGLMADRWNVFWIYPVTLVIWSVAGFVTGFAANWTGLMMCRFLLGIAEAGHWPCALRTTQHVLPSDKRSTGNGILQSGAAVGAIVTPWVVVMLVREPGSWRYPFWVVGGLGVTWVALWFMFVRAKDLYTPAPQTDPRASNAALDSREDATAGILRIVADRRFLALVVVVVSINMAWHYFRAWLTTFLSDLQYEKNEAILFNSAYFTAADAGSLSAGFGTLWLIRRGLPVHGARALVFFLCALLASLGTVVAFLPKGPMLLGLLLIIGFGALGLFPNYYSFTQELSIRHQGKVTGMLGCINWLAVAALQAIVGTLVERTGSHALGMIVAALAPMVGFLTLIVLWKAPSRVAVTADAQ